MSDRKLAHIERISKIENINGADNIEKVYILGWQCIVAKKDNFKVGDLVIYCEIDSVLPNKPEFEFLRSRNFRIRTIKLKGQVSQGLVLPLNSVKRSPMIVDVGTDVTEYIGITKYLTPSERQEIENQERKITNEKSKLKKFLLRYSFFRRLFLTKNQKHRFPYWVSKTDEPCCISGTSILNTDKGDFTIKEICESKETFKVKSYNIDTDTIEYKEIINKSIKSNNNDWYEIELEDSTKVVLTSEHLVYLPKLNCYRQVKDLKSNDLVLLDK